MTAAGIESVLAEIEAIPSDHEIDARVVESAEKTRRKVERLLDERLGRWAVGQCLFVVG